LEKGAVTVSVKGKKYFYFSAVSRVECVRAAVKSFSDRFFSGDLNSLLLHFVEEEHLNPEEIEVLRAELAAKAKSLKGPKKPKRR